MEIKVCSEEDYVRMVEIWERAVRATHDFLSEDDINSIKEKLPALYFPSVELFGADSENGFVGFIGFYDDKIEMLFVDPSFHGCGIGSRLIEFAKKRGFSLVDVNEQNPRALRFYKKHGFVVASRDEYDDAGRPFPILHLALAPEA